MFKDVLSNIKIYKHIENGILLEYKGRWVFFDKYDLYFRPLKNWMFNVEFSKGLIGTKVIALAVSEDNPADIGIEMTLGRMPGFYFEVKDLASKPKKNIRVYGFSQSRRTGRTLFLGEVVDKEMANVMSLQKFLKKNKVIKNGRSDS